MRPPLINAYADTARAEAYDQVGFPATYWLGFRDLPGILQAEASGNRALDFGCGAGRSTRFLKELGFHVTGADVSAAMLEHARRRDPHGEYVQVADGDLSALHGQSFDVILSAYTFDNVPRAGKARLFRQLGELLAPGGVLLNLASTAEIYVHEWVSFSTRDFPENARAQDGDRVHVVMLDGPDRRPIEDELCTEEGYQAIFQEAGLRCARTHRPLGRPDEPYPWRTELTVSPWAIHVLRVDTLAPGEPDA